MSKAVLISIKPEWCELIASGKKTVEVRKSKPKLETPFKCYIYETKSKNYYSVFHENTIGKIIGEFVCDNATAFRVFENGTVQGFFFKKLEKSCLTHNEIARYIGKNRVGYSWHISNLIIYDKPREINEFSKPCIREDEFDGGTYCDCLHCDLAGDSDDGVVACNRKLTRPPQSWCYVEEVS